MEKKYILTNETNIYKGRILHRIQAVRNFVTVKAGDLGGWIEKEENLSHKGSCWVFDEAKVYDDACVFDGAQVFGSARICGNACVYDNAWVYDEAWIYDKARICGNAQIFGGVWVFGNARISKNASISASSDYYVIGPIGSRNDFTTFYKTKDGDIWVSYGCFNGSIADFEKFIRIMLTQNSIMLRLLW